MFDSDSSGLYPTAQEDLSAIKSALGGYDQSGGLLSFLEPRFLRGVLVGILIFYVMLYYTRRYKNRDSMKRKCNDNVEKMKNAAEKAYFRKVVAK
ncbi:hypothetical protein AK88_00945 [Plasmodium fragile]|uniref:Uncharacterized protein n=1 Tax=Plasmodium fragile TaxID=5857 RepID=A0A0D9QQB4_PLAFR|nr:uncharacterized protein AK88_00945 [Plasmodium fragile]KJP89285.1 hypothetical protein AK88_00945 [Plasmodium fragile]